MLSFLEHALLYPFRFEMFPCGIEMIGSDITKQEAILYDHRPHQLFEDDYIRVCQIPRRKV